MGKDAAVDLAPFRERMGQFVQQLIQEMYPDGLPPGTSFYDLEVVAEQVSDEVGRELIESQLRKQATSDETHPASCPTCQGPMEKADKKKLRRLTTTHGEVAWEDNTKYCPRCRRGFSPSRPSTRS